MDSPGIPSDVQNLLQRLIFISMIEEGVKMNITSKCFDFSNSWVTVIKRTFQSEDRTKTVDFIHSVSDQLSMTLEKYKKSKAVIQIIVDHLNRSIGGIEKLINTYKDDPDVVSKLQVILENISFQTAQMGV